jgi:hypothetical protein
MKGRTLAPCKKRPPATHRRRPCSANAGLPWLARERPDLEAARESAARMVNDAQSTAEIIRSGGIALQKGQSARRVAGRQRSSARDARAAAKRLRPVLPLRADLLVRTPQSTSTKATCNLTSNPRSRVSLADLGLDLTLAVTVTIGSDFRTPESDSESGPAPAAIEAAIAPHPAR